MLNIGVTPAGLTSEPSLSANQNCLSEENGVQIAYTNGQSKSNPSNLLNSLDSKLWLSPSHSKPPHVFLLNLTGMRQRPRFFRYFGISCWHAYTSNPAQVKILIASQEGKQYLHWQTFFPEQKAGL